MFFFFFFSSSSEWETRVRVRVPTLLLFDSSSPRLSPFPSSDLGLLFSYPNKDLDLGFGFQSGTSTRADGLVFVPRGGDAAGGMRAQVGPHSSIHVRVRVRVRSCSFRSEIGSI